jgi:hypothetical protein
MTALLIHIALISNPVVVLFLWLGVPWHCVRLGLPSSICHPPWSQGQRAAIRKSDAGYLWHCSLGLSILLIWSEGQSGCSIAISWLNSDAGVLSRDEMLHMWESLRLLLLCTNMEHAWAPTVVYQYGTCMGSYCCVPIWNMHGLLLLCTNMEHAWASTVVYQYGTCMGFYCCVPIWNMHGLLLLCTNVAVILLCTVQHRRDANSVTQMMCIEGTWRHLAGSTLAVRFTGDGLQTKPLAKPYKTQQVSEASLNIHQTCHWPLCIQNIIRSWRYSTNKFSIAIAEIQSHFWI